MIHIGHIDHYRIVLLGHGSAGLCGEVIQTIQYFFLNVHKYHDFWSARWEKLLLHVVKSSSLNSLEVPHVVETILFPFWILPSLVSQLQGYQLIRFS